ncbi:MAG: 1-deoxy-D-xylulose-5-phosphate reductoisomerase, partial [Arsenophonus sp. ET-DL12-MAG3]
ANEVSVEAFLSGQLRFTDIAKVNMNIVERLSLSEPDDIDTILEIDCEARRITNNYIKTLSISY